MHKTTSNIWFTSDPHYSHRNVIKYCNRPFKNVEEMEEKLIENYNACVAPSDICYFVGDIFFCGMKKAKEIMCKLNGYKILIRGNHDRNPSKMLEIGFDEVHEKLIIDLGARQAKQIKICHYPYKPKLDDIPNHVISEIDKIKQLARRKGTDAFIAFDYALKKFCDTGSITNEQRKRLMDYDPRFFTRRYEDDGGWLICGHVHEKWAEKERMVNVGVDVRDFKPIHIDEIRAIVDR